VTAQWGEKRAEFQPKMDFFYGQKLNTCSVFPRVTDECGEMSKSKIAK
jgi:hypothetical protein